MPELDGFFNTGNYLKGADVPLGQEYTMTIHAAGPEQVGEGRDAETKVVVHFEKSKKGLVLNKGNYTVLRDLYGSNSDGWVGKPIVLFTIMTNNPRTNQPGPGLRLKPVQVGQAQAVLEQPAVAAAATPPPAQMAPPQDFDDDIPF